MGIKMERQKKIREQTENLNRSACALDKLRAARGRSVVGDEWIDRQIKKHEQAHRDALAELRRLGSIKWIHD